jgi:ribonucleoside-triphosphate reductase
MDLVIGQLYARYKILAAKKVKNFPFLMGQGLWLGSEKLGSEDILEEILKHGTLSVGFIGLAETLTALTGFHHGESPQSQELGLKIVKFMRNICDTASEKMHMNVTLLATPAEGLSGRFVNIDKDLFGEIKGITDKGYYTNSFHVPVEYETTAYNKITLEAPYHALTNAGHITTVELDGDASANLTAYEGIIRCMKNAGIGYGGINHPVDTDPVCGYTGILAHTCPKCGRNENDEYIDSDGNNKGVIGFKRVRRVTGYLSTTDKFNDGKRKELASRVKHTSQS